MSSQELHSINRLFFSQLSGLDPLSECYYYFALTAKQQRQGGVTATQTGTEIGANIMDAVAVLTQVGSAAIAAGRGKSSNDDGASKPSTFKEEQLDPVEKLPRAPTLAGQTDSALAGNVLLASLPTRTTASTSFTKELAKMKKLHAIKRRLWETHNSVLGRQESMNVRAPKKTLNLTSSGNTTGNDIRREVEKFKTSISVQGTKTDAEAHLAALQEAAADAAADAASAAEEARLAAEKARAAAAASDSSESLTLAAARLSEEEAKAAAAAAEAAANALLAEAARSEEETATAVAVARAAAERSGENATLWAVRSRVDSALESIINLQSAAKILQDLLRQYPPPSVQQLGRHRADVAIHRLALASALGLKLGAPVPPDVVEMTADRAGKVLAKAVKDAIIKKAADVIAQAEAIQGPSAIEDDSLLLILSTYKGKKLIARAVPMLAPGDRITAVLAGIRHLPHFVASATSGTDFENADSLLASKLAQWVRTIEPPSISDSSSSSSSGVASSFTRTLEVLNCWLLELQQRHPGHVIRALLQHPGASEVISALLLRGETEAAAAEALSSDSVNVDEDIKAAARKDASLWRTTTDTLGRAFVEAE